MGTWGTAIFSDDTAADVRDQYKMLVAYDYSDEEADKLTKNEFFKEFNPKTDEDEEKVFWLALALAKWQTGRLDEETKNKAIEIIENGGDLERWDEEDKATYKKRVKVLEELKQKLCSPQPPRKKVSKPPGRRCPWKKGDLLAFRIDDKKLLGSPFYNKYILIRVAEITKSPVCYFLKDLDYYESCHVILYGWVGDEIPDKSIADELEIIPLHHCFIARKLLWESPKKSKSHITVIGNDPYFKGYDSITFTDSGSSPVPSFTISLPWRLKDYL